MRQPIQSHQPDTEHAQKQETTQQMRQQLQHAHHDWLTLMRWPNTIVAVLLVFCTMYGLAFDRSWSLVWLLLTVVLTVFWAWRGWYFYHRQNKPQ